MKTITVIILSFLTYFFHVLVAPAIAIFGFKIDFIMIWIVTLALFTRKWYLPVLCGVYCGIAVDISTQAGTYVNTGIYLAVAILCSLALIVIRENRLVIYALSVFTAVCAKHLILSFVLYILRLSENFSPATFVHGIPAALYSAVLSLGLYFLNRWLFELPILKTQIKEKHHYLN